MRLSALPLVLAGLLGSAALMPAPARAYPPNYPYGSPAPMQGYAPLPVSPYGYPSNGYSSPYGPNPYGGYPIAADPGPYAPAPVRSCNRGTVLTGAAIGGGLGAMLANNSRNRRWSLPMGAAMGGILGGIVSGC